METLQLLWFHLYLWASSLVKMIVSRIRNVMANDSINVLYLKILHLNEHLTTWINPTTKSSKIGIQRINETTYSIYVSTSYQEYNVDIFLKNTAFSKQIR